MGKIEATPEQVPISDNLPQQWFLTAPKLSVITLGNTDVTLAISWGLSALAHKKTPPPIYGQWRSSLCLTKNPFGFGYSGIISLSPAAINK